MRRLHVIIACALAGVGAGWIWSEHESRRPLTANDIKGTWKSTSEIGGFTHTLLLVNPPTFQYWFSSDMKTGEIMPREGMCEIRDMQLTLSYVPRYPSEVGRAKEEHEVWHMLRINGYPVLMRSDAHSIWQREGKLYDYGILMKGHEPSIKDLYQDKNAGWADPFVHGPNKPF